MRLRSRGGAGVGAPETVMFFSSDIHGSDVCWAKFINAAKVYRANALVMGGDLAGKAVVPLVRAGGDRYDLEFLGRRSQITEDQLADTEKGIRFNGFYPYVCDPEQVAALDDAGALDVVFREVISAQVRRWLAMAEERLAGHDVRLYVMPGNDDELFIDEVLAESTIVVNPDGKIVELGGLQMLSCSWVPTTPWDSPRECSEERLNEILDELVAQLDPETSTIMNLHSPPFGTGLDDAPEMNADLSMVRRGGQPRMVPVGSHAVRRAIERVRPVLALHGHIHESRGIAKIGTTKCVNPGSSYGEGTLDACLVRLAGPDLRSVQLIRG